MEVVTIFVLASIDKESNSREMPSMDGVIGRKLV